MPSLRACHSLPALASQPHAWPAGCPLSPPCTHWRSVIREMLAELDDPYSRFIPPAEFASMLKYDVSGVGLNLGTAEEFVNKTVSLAAAGLEMPVLHSLPHPVLVDCPWWAGWQPLVRPCCQRSLRWLGWDFSATLPLKL